MSDFTNFQLAYEISPIFFVDGIAQGMTDGTMPVANLLEAGYFNNVNSAGTYLSSNQLNNFFAHFKPVPGSMLTNWQVANYPFANSVIAANASIAQPLQVSLLMMCPASNGISFSARQSILSNLQTQVQNHVAQGGTFDILTPAYVYQTCLLTSLRDITSIEDRKVQSIYQWDFIQPLLTQQQASIATNLLYTRLEKGFVIAGTDTNSGLTSVTPRTGP